MGSLGCLVVVWSIRVRLHALVLFNISLRTFTRAQQVFVDFAWVRVGLLGRTYGSSGSFGFCMGSLRRSGPSDLRDHPRSRGCIQALISVVGFSCDNIDSLGRD